MTRAQHVNQSHDSAVLESNLILIMFGFEVAEGLNRTLDIFEKIMPNNFLAFEKVTWWLEQHASVIYFLFFLSVFAHVLAAFK